MAETTLRKDSEWSVIDSEPCRVISFTPLASIENGKILASKKMEPYASVTLECKKIPVAVKGFITHKEDFAHLWAAFRERRLADNEEAIIIWSKKHLKTYAKICSAFMPRLWVMICPKGAFEIMTDSNWKPELTGEARWIATKSAVEWKPEVMK